METVAHRGDVAVAERGRRRRRRAGGVEVQFRPTERKERGDDVAASRTSPSSRGGRGRRGRGVRKLSRARAGPWRFGVDVPLLCRFPQTPKLQRQRKGSERRDGGGGEERGGGSRVRARRRGAGFMEGKGGRGAELAVAEGAPLLCFRRGDGDVDTVTVGTTGTCGLGWTAVGRRWAVTACLPTVF